jgi:hypothetical protein
VLFLNVSALHVQDLMLPMEVSIPQGPELHLNVLHYIGLSCSWRGPHHRVLSCIWTCLHYRGLCCSWRCYTIGSELRLDVSALQRFVLLLEVSTPEGPKLHLDVSALQYIDDFFFNPDFDWKQIHPPLHTRHCGIS